MNFIIEIQKPKVILTFDEASFETITWMGKKSRLHALFLQLLQDRERNMKASVEHEIIQEFKKLEEADKTEILEAVRAKLDKIEVTDGELERTDK